MAYKDVGDYIAKAPAATRTMAEQIRQLITEAVPGVEEKLSYGMPYYGYHGRLIYFGVYQDYVGLYLMSEARETLKDELEKYRTSKATYKFMVGQPLPVALIKKIVKLQAAANEQKK